MSPLIAFGLLRLLVGHMESSRFKIIFVASGVIAFAIVAEYLIAKEPTLLEGLAEDLERLRQKSDYRFSGKP